MKRQIIKIDEEKCNGCGLCAKACHEGAIDIIDGKAKLVREHFCDGLGDCLPECPTGAITFEEREAPEYDEAAVQRSKIAKALEKHQMGGGCPGSAAMSLGRAEAPKDGCPGSAPKAFDQESGQAAYAAPAAPVSRLAQWPCQIKLLPPKAPFYDGAKLLVAADCTAYAYANMHEEFMKGKITAVGCPKLDAVDYSEKLTDIISSNDIKEVTLVRMEVPCCGGLENAVKKALQQSGKFIPWRVVTISRDGKILD